MAYVLYVTIHKYYWDALVYFGCISNKLGVWLHDTTHFTYQWRIAQNRSDRQLEKENNVEAIMRRIKGIERDDEIDKTSDILQFGDKEHIGYRFVVPETYHRKSNGEIVKTVGKVINQKEFNKISQSQLAHLVKQEKLSKESRKQELATGCRKPNKLTPFDDKALTHPRPIFIIEADDWGLKPRAQSNE